MVVVTLMFEGEDFDGCQRMDINGRKLLDYTTCRLRVMEMNREQGRTEVAACMLVWLSNWG